MTDQPKPTPPQDGPHAPQDGPQRPDAGAETPDGAGGRQAGADGREVLREQYAAAIGAIWDGWIADWVGTEVPDPERILADTVLAVRDQELERLQARLDEAQQNARALDQGREELFARIARVRALHQPDPDGRTGYQPDDDDTPGAYGDIAQACRECGSSDLAVRWPCPTVRALDAELAPANPGEQYATRAAAIRDQSALAQIRLHIAAHRPRLQYADPILLGKIEAVLRQVGELEAAGGREGA